MTMRPMMLLLALLCLPLVSPAQQSPLFRFQGEVHTPENISIRMNQLYGSMLSEQYSALKTLIDEMVFDTYVEREAKKLGRPVREVGFELLQVPEPREDEVLAFYTNNQQRIGQPLDTVKDRIRRMLHREAMARQREAVLARIKHEGSFELLAPPPPLPRVAIDTRGRPFKGNPDAPIELVEFGDYQCPNCKRAATLIDDLMEQHPDMLKIYYMDFPINRSGISREVAVGGMCAMAQGRFWRYHDLAFQEQDGLTRESPAQFAEHLGLDVAAFRACMTEPATRAQVERSFEEGRRLGITATPTLFVDGKPFVTQHLIRDLGAYIEDRMAAKQ
jgi:protein-disulfide isomerase